MENLTNKERDYYELLVDMLEDGIIDDSERNILNKRKEKYGISDNRAKELENIACGSFENEQLIDNNTVNNYLDNSEFINKISEEIENWEIEMSNLRYKINELDNNNPERKALKDKINKYFEIGSMFITDISKINELDYNNPERKILENKLKKSMSMAGIELDTDISNLQYKIMELDNNNPERKALVNKLAKSMSMVDIKKNIKKMDTHKVKITRMFTNDLNVNKEIMRRIGNSAYDRELIRKAIGCFKRAKKCFLYLVALDEEDDYSWFLLANAYLNLEDYDNAIDCYKKAININENDARYWNNYGVSLERVNRLEEAKNCYKIASELDPNEKLYSNNFNKAKVGKIIKGIGNLFK